MFPRTHASGRWLGTKQAGVCAVGYMSSPKGKTFQEECEPTLPQGSPKGDMSGSEGGKARRREGGSFSRRHQGMEVDFKQKKIFASFDKSQFLISFTPWLVSVQPRPARGLLKTPLFSVSP